MKRMKEPILAWLCIAALMILACGGVSTPSVPSGPPTNDFDRMSTQRAMTQQAGWIMTVAADYNNNILPTTLATMLAPSARPPEIQNELFAGYTGDSEIPFIILHPKSGERLGKIENYYSENSTGIVWTSSNGESITFFTDSNGYPRSAVIKDDVILYSNYTNNTVDITIIHPDGRQEIFRSTLGTSLSNRHFSSQNSNRGPIAIAFQSSFQKQDLNFWIELDEALFALEIGTCISVGASFSTNIAALAALGMACHGPLLDEAIREGRAENKDVSTLEQIQDGLELYGCYAGNPMDCINKYVGDMADTQRAANAKAAKAKTIPPVEVVPTKCQGKYCK